MSWYKIVGVYRLVIFPLSGVNAYPSVIVLSLCVGVLLVDLWWESTLSLLSLTFTIFLQIPTEITFPLLTAHICTSSKCSCTFGPKLCRVNVRLPEQSIFLIILCNQLYPEWKLSLIDTGRRFPCNKELKLKCFFGFLLCFNFLNVLHSLRWSGFFCPFPFVEFCDTYKL